MGQARMVPRAQWRKLACTVVAGALTLAACGSSDGDEATSGATGTGAAGETVKAGVLHSLSGTMSISEVAVKNASLLAIKEINAAGGVLGKQIEPVVEDGESKPEVFAQKIEKLLTTDDVAVVFGGWTSASRKAMKPVVEGAEGLLFYPVQYEGLEVSPNIFYTGATTNQQIVPALDYMKEQGLTNVYLVGSDYVFPRTANKEIKAYAAANGLNILGEEYLQLGDTNVQGIVQKVLDAKPQVVFNTLNGDSNVSFFKELKAKGNTPDKIQTISVSIAEEEVGGVGVDNLVGHLVAWNYYQTTAEPMNEKFVAAFKAEYGAEKNTADPIEAGYNSVYIWKAAVEKAGSFDVDKVIAAAGGIELDTPEGKLTVHPTNHHVSKTARIGMINAEGLIDEVWNSGKPVEPDPCLDTYAWADGLATGEARAAPPGSPVRESAMETFVGNLYIGITLASILLLVGLGLTFTFGQMGVINMAHGELIMAGAYVPYVLQTSLFEGAKGAAVLVAFPVAFVVGGLVGVALDRLLLRRMYDRPLDTLLVTFGVSLVLQQAARDLFGANNKDVVTPTWLRGQTDLLRVTLTHTRLFVLLTVVVTMAAVWVFMSRLAAGRRMRAVMQNRDLAAVSGLRTARVDATTFFLGSGLAGIAGVAVSLIGPIGTGTGTAYILSAFLVVIVGGFGKLRGAVLAALMLGTLNAFVERSTSSTLGRAAVFAFVILFLQLRPNGIVSFRTRGLAA